MALVAASVVAAGCGGGGGGRDPLANVPAQGGLRAKLGAAADPVASDFPATKGRTLQELASSLTGGPQAALAGSVFIPGENRLAFGVVDSGGKFVYGKSAVYIAPKPGAKARGPYPAPADLLFTDPAFRSKQAATDTAPFAAVYSADVRFPKPGPWSVLTVTQSGGGMVGAATQLKVLAPGKDLIPEVGQKAPRIATDTVASAKGDEAAIDTRVPPAPNLHQTSFADVVGKKPVALLIATPQLCQSRVCGPVTDIALQLQAKYGDRMQFIHQEVYAQNNPNKG
ncbi:MAG: hypothetical protein QOE28_1548, partial [Solirubrobacteraceae bacterium]|nr:hypothetical protein [Solirubrobacteraceae bacterium]